MNLPPEALAAGFLVGAALTAALMGMLRISLVRRARALQGELEQRRQWIPPEVSQAREEELKAQLAATREELEDRLRALTAEHADLQRKQTEAERVHQSKALDGARQQQELRHDVLAESRALGSEVDQLLGLVKTFDRWQAEMDTLLGHNQEMHAKNREFFSIVNQVVVLALNASIEASKAGVYGRGFGVVAEGVRDLAFRMERLSKNHNENLHKNDLITTTTFQDLQAGGKMITAAVIGLKVINDKIQGRVEQADEARLS